jgi:CTP:molybdopterin cytidylyltransferase MocA
MGQPKALLPWQDTTLLGYCLREQRAAGIERQVVVLGPNSDAIRATISGTGNLELVYNLEVETGRSTSIRIAASAIPDAAGVVLVQSVDQPCPAVVIEALLAGLGNADVAIPTFEGRRGHPVCVAGRLLPELRALSEETQGLRAVVRRAGHVVEVPVASDSVRWNLNDPAAYAAAVAAAGGT